MHLHIDSTVPVTIPVYVRVSGEEVVIGHLTMDLDGITAHPPLSGAEALETRF